MLSTSVTQWSGLLAGGKAEAGRSVEEIFGCFRR
jgi:hypothetical protein